MADNHATDLRPLRDLLRLHTLRVVGAPPERQVDAGVKRLHLGYGDCGLYRRYLERLRRRRPGMLACCGDSRFDYSCRWVDE